MAMATDGFKIIRRHNFLVKKLEAKIVSMVYVVMRTASACYYKPQICTVWCTKLQKHNPAQVNLKCYSIQEMRGIMPPKICIRLPGTCDIRYFRTKLFLLPYIHC